MDDFEVHLGSGSSGAQADLAGLRHLRPEVGEENLQRGVDTALLLALISYDNAGRHDDEVQKNSGPVPLQQCLDSKALTLGTTNPNVTAAAATSLRNPQHSVPPVAVDVDPRNQNTVSLNHDYYNDAVHYELGYSAGASELLHFDPQCNKTVLMYPSDNASVGHLTPDGVEPLGAKDVCEGLADIDGLDNIYLTDATTHASFSSPSCLPAHASMDLGTDTKYDRTVLEFDEENPHSMPEFEFDDILPSDIQIDRHCFLCDQTFQFPKDFRRHFRGLHIEVKPFKCPVQTCKYFTLGFAREDNRKRHIGNKHPHLSLTSTFEV